MQQQYISPFLCRHLGIHSTFIAFLLWNSRHFNFTQSTQLTAWALGLDRLFLRHHFLYVNYTAILLHCYKAFCWDYTLSDKIQMSFTRKKLSLYTNFECFHFKRFFFTNVCSNKLKKQLEFYFFFIKVKNSKHFFLSI